MICGQFLRRSVFLSKYSFSRVMTVQERKQLRNNKDHWNTDFIYDDIHFAHEHSKTNGGIE